MPTKPTSCRNAGHAGDVARSADEPLHGYRCAPACASSPGDRPANPQGSLYPAAAPHGESRPPQGRVGGDSRPGATPSSTNSRPKAAGRSRPRLANGGELSKGRLVSAGTDLRVAMTWLGRLFRAQETGARSRSRVAVPYRRAVADPRCASAPDALHAHGARRHVGPRPAASIWNCNSRSRSRPVSCPEQSSKPGHGITLRSVPSTRPMALDNSRHSATSASSVLRPLAVSL